MARAHARILTSIWGDAEFTKLSAGAQWLYVAILSQPNLSFAGVVALTPRRWAGFARTMTPAKVTRALAELVAAGFVIYDENTEEIAVRSFMKNDGILSSPNVMKAAARDWRLIVSPEIRAAVMAGVPPDQREGFGEPFPEGLPDPTPEGSRGRRADSFSPSPSPSPSPAVGAKPSAESAAPGEPVAGRNDEEEDEENLKKGKLADAAGVLARRDLQRKLNEGGRVANRQGWLRTAAANRLETDGGRLGAIADASPDLDGNQLADALDRQAMHRPPAYEPEGVGQGVPIPDNVRELLAKTLKRAE